MRIEIIRISPYIQTKIYEKHSIMAEEVIAILKEGSPIFKRVGGNQLMAIGLHNRYITLFFNYNEKRRQATITTAYPSDKTQIQYYKRKRR